MFKQSMWFMFVTALLVGVPVTAEQGDSPYTLYLPMISRQAMRPAPLIAPDDGAYQLVMRRGETDATWQQLYFACDRDVDGVPDAGYRFPGELTAVTRMLTATVPISKGQRLEIRLYANTFGSVITPHPIWYSWDSEHTRTGAPAPLVVVGESPWDTRWECDGDYDHRDLQLEISFEKW